MAIPLHKLEGKYEILAKIREGGMGAIYKVRHRLLGDLRVIKVMHPQLETDVALKERFLREAKSAIRLRHPNIAQLYDYTVSDEGDAFIVLEYIHGWTLEELIQRREPTPVGLALEIALQGLRAIAHLHDKGVLHRDIAPDNLMLTRDFDALPRVKLIDLGIAKTPDDSLTVSGTFLGKFRYAAPEHFGSHEGIELDATSDLYSFGVVLYELFTGSYPITGTTASSLIAGHLFRPPLAFTVSDLAGRVPEDLRQVLLQTLAKRPGDRFQSAAELSEALLPIARRYPFDTLEVRELLALTQEERPTASEGSREGTTQSRFDLEFSSASTPLPARPTAAPPPPHLVPVPAAPSAPDADATLRLPVPVAPPALLAVTRRVEELIEEGQFDAARKVVGEHAAAAGDATAGDAAACAELGQRIDEIERIANRPRLRRLLAEARREAEGERWTAAIAHLEEAQQLDPAEPQVAALLAESRRAARQQEAERERQAAIAAQIEEISGLLQRGALAEAAAALVRAGEVHGKDERWTALRETLRQLEAAAERERQLAEQRAQVARLVAEAEALVNAERFAEAHDRLLEARRLEPADASLGERLAEVAERRRQADEERERQAAIAAQGESIAERIAQGELLDARMLLVAAERRFGAVAPFAALAERLAEREAAARQERLRAALAEVDALTREDRFTAALEALDAARLLAPDDAALDARRQTLLRELQHRTALEERQRDIERTAAHVASVLAAGDLEQAEGLLQLAQADLGDDPAWPRLGRQLAERRRTVRDAEVQRLAREAARLAAGGDLPAALEALTLAAAVDPDNAVVAAEIERLEQLRAEGLRRERREKALEQAGERFEQLLAEGELEAAAAEITAAESEFGAAPVLTRWRTQLDQLRRRRERELRAEELLRQAKEARDAGQPETALEHAREALRLSPASLLARLLVRELENAPGSGAIRPPAPTAEAATAAHAERADELVALGRSLAQSEEFARARAALLQALELVPRHAEGVTLLASVEACLAVQQEEAQVARAVADETLRIRRLVQEGDPAQALFALDRATRRLGDHASFRSLRYDVAQAQLALNPAPPMPRHQPADIAAAAHFVDLPLPSQPAPDAPGPDAPRPTFAPTPAWLAPLLRHRGRLAAAAAGLLVLLLVVVGLLRRDSPPPPPLPAEEVTAAVLTPGSVALVALPWGEITRLVDADGAEQALGAARFTPLRLELQPGRYRLTLRHPPSGVSREIEVEVKAGGSQRQVVELQPIDPGQYFAGERF